MICHQCTQAAHSGKKMHAIKSYVLHRALRTREQERIVTAVAVHVNDEMKNTQVE